LLFLVHRKLSMRVDISRHFWNSRWTTRILRRRCDFCRKFGIRIFTKMETCVSAFCIRQSTIRRVVSCLANAGILLQ